MRDLDEHGQRRSFRHRGAGVIVVLALTFCGAIPAAALDVVAPPTAAPTATTPPSPAPSENAVPTKSLAISSPASDTLFPTSMVTISGTKDSDGTVEVQSLTGGPSYCKVSEGTTWACSFSAPTGRNTLTVFQYFDTDSGAPEQARLAIRVLPAPTISGTSPIVTTGLITGTGYPGSGILLSGANVGTCPGIVQPSGYWSCPLTVSSSGDYGITAQQTWEDDDAQPGGSTAEVIVRVDRDPPALPLFTQPAAGSQADSQPVGFAGSGESGGRVDVFVDGTLVCSGGVSSGRWSCTAPLAGGQHNVQGIQWDAAGNPSGASVGFPVTVTVASVPAPAPAPVAPPAANPAQTRSPEPAPVPVPAPSPSQDTAQPPALTPAFPFFPPPIGGISGLPPLETWGTPTDYGAAIPTVASTNSAMPWLWGLVFGIGFILLVALPLRLVLTAMRGRFRRHYSARDHSRLTASEVPLLRPRLTLAGAIGAAAVLAALAGGIQGEVRYLRLAIAIAVALLVLNGVSVALTTRFASKALGGSSRLRLVPLFLGIAAVTALISRGGGIQPPVIVGVVIAASFMTDLGRRSRGMIAMIQLVVTMLLGVGAWIAHSVLGAAAGFIPLLLSEALAALCIAAIGSGVVLALPVSRMPGRHIFEWSPVAWVAVALVSATLAGVIIAGAAAFPVPLTAGLSLAFAATCLGLWAWIRLSEPSFAPTPAAARRN